MDRKMTPLSLHFPNFDQIDQANNSLRRKLIGSDDDDDDDDDEDAVGASPPSLE